MARARARVSVGEFYARETVPLLQLKSAVVFVVRQQTAKLCGLAASFPCACARGVVAPLRSESPIATRGKPPCHLVPQQHGEARPFHRPRRAAELPGSPPAARSRGLAGHHCVHFTRSPIRPVALRDRFSRRNGAQSHRRLVGAPSFSTRTVSRAR